MITKEVGFYFGAMVSALLYIYGYEISENNQNGTYLAGLFLVISINTAIFFYHNLKYYFNTMLAWALKKYGCRIESTRRKLQNADRNFSVKTVGIGLKNEMRLCVDASFAGGKTQKQFKSQILWLPIEWFNKIGSHGAGVINTPKNAVVYYLRALPFIYQVDISFVDKKHLLPKDIFYTIKYLAITIPPVLFVIFKSFIAYGTIF